MPADRRRHDRPARRCSSRATCRRSWRPTCRAASRATSCRPRCVLTPEQEFFAGGYLNGYAALPASASCAVTHTVVGEQLVGNRRSKETHSLDHPCAYVRLISTKNYFVTSQRPAGYSWCDFCYPARRDG